ncbi:glutamate-5-semialdehyde dehydrogenase [Thermocoleostomius sinensis]|uniref:Gamma-glutamyl phosphate reductase n=1 Tax=Thermocoleostomius sinensis A174 TaxID=2016057 RepID=A0A9E8ZGW2_9CYAN|nr:glutamate-5-semialdehyde dehydrogenase [Thermocoleostomius sinensis]WAL61604.1 glutamate-5-semialdehyde dehydrogenase [Thermocoleostomius sinensis A174]
MTSQTLTPSLATLARETREAARQLAIASTETRNQAIEAIAAALEAASAEIVAANQSDCEAALAEGLAKSLYGRLKLDAEKLMAAIAGVRNVGRLPDPVGVRQIHRELDDGLVLQRITCPLGVLGVIFEARPDAVMQIAALAIKSGNAVMLKGGKEAVRSCEALVEAIHRGLTQVGLDPALVRLLTTREETLALLHLDQYVDLIIPRGSNAFVRFVQENTRIPVLGHADGICHLYVDQAADVPKAVQITVDAKTQYPSACNTIETLLVHKQIAPAFLQQIIPALQSKQVEVRADEPTRQLIGDAFSELTPATESDWATEYSDLILSIKLVESLEAAIDHINTYGSRHTEAIVTEDAEAASHFTARVDAAGVFHNCSTRFADGFRYGFGAEVGISTQKMPPRGPVGLEGLVTYKYQLVGNGHIAATYTGANAKAFTHRNLTD